MSGDGYLALMVIGGCILYFLPSIIAGARKKKHNIGAIQISNVLFGWTGIGWLILLVWACTDDPKPKSEMNEKMLKELVELKAKQMKQHNMQTNTSQNGCVVRIKSVKKD